jgi:hypothetical protein
MERSGHPATGGVGDDAPWAAMGGRSPDPHKPAWRAHPHLSRAWVAVLLGTLVFGLVTDLLSKWARVPVYCG